MPRVYFINRFYWPDEPATAQLLTDLASALAARGMSITVIASRRRPISPRLERHNGVSIIRVRSSGMGRIADFAVFHLGVLWQLLRRLKREDVVVALTDPPLIGVSAWFAARVRGARLVHWIQDIYPEIAAQITGHRWLMGFAPIRSAAWRGAEACVIPGRDMASVVAGAEVRDCRLLIRPNWAPAGLGPADERKVEELRAAWNLRGKFVIGYSGNLGRVHDLDPLLELAEHLRADEEFAFLFVGHGPQRRALEEAARRRGLHAVQFRPPEPRQRLAISLSVADVHCVTLRAGAERCVFPSKLYGIAAVGRPVVFIGPTRSEIATAIRTSDFGKAFEPGCMSELAHWLRALLRDGPLRSRLRASALAFEPQGLAKAVASWHRVLLAPDLLRGEIADTTPRR